MLQKSKLSDYINDHHIEWVPEMPDGVPPEDIYIPSEHVLYRLTREVRISQDDLSTYYEKDPNRDWGDILAESCAVSMFNDLSKTDKLIRIPSLRDCKGVAKIVLNPTDGVVKQTFGKVYHYSWWKTNCFDINTVETVKVL